MRVKITGLFLVFLFGALFFGLFRLQILSGKKLREMSLKNCIRLLPQPGARGRILDRSDQVLVDNHLTYDVMVSSQDRPQLDQALEAIGKILNINRSELKKKYYNNYTASFLPVTVARNIEMKKTIALEELKMDLPNIIIQPNPVREYPHGRLAAHVIGYLNEIDHWRLTKLSDYGYGPKDIVGYTGVEEKYDYYLRQQEGALSVEVDSRGRFVRVLGFKPPRKGKDIQLTLDLKIQQIVEAALGERKGAAVIMDPHNGEIFALASSPSYDPEVFIRRNVSQVSRMFNDPDAPLMDRAISSAYPAASVFKLVVATGALESKKINLGTTFNCSGGMNVGRRRFKCWSTHHEEDLLNAIAHSCDVFFYRAGLALGAQGIHDYAVKFGFSKLTGIDLPYETAGFVPDPLWKKLSRFENWYDGDTANFSIGQGDLLVTPIQVARMTAVFANHGYLVTPYLIKGIDGQKVDSYKRKLVRINIKDNLLAPVREGMRRVIVDPQGTASIFSGVGVSVAGKTGTAQVTGKPSHGWFSGFFPYEKPKFVICVFLENGGSGYNATSVVKHIVEEMVKEELI